MTGEDVANAIGEEYGRGYGYVRIRCYNTKFHNNDDNDPSLVIYDGDRGFYCYACGMSGSHQWLMKQFGMTNIKRSNRTFIPKEYKEYDFDSIYPKLSVVGIPTKQKLYNDKGIKPEIQDRAGWRYHTDQIEGWGQGIFIPYYWQGQMVAARLRMLHGPVRFKSLPGGESFPYMADNAKKEYVYVCEGETDTLTACMAGFPAVGIPGATNTNAIRKLIDIAKLYGTRLCILPDNDKAGSDFANRVKKLCDDNGIECDVLKVPVGKDVNEWYNMVDIKEFKEYLNEHRPIPKDIAHR